MRIRKAQRKDVDECFRLARQEKEHYWEKKDFYNSLKNKDVEFYVAEENGKIIGFSEAFITPTRRKEALMHETRVDVKYRGKDIGTRLVKAVTNALFKKNVKIISALIKPELKPFYVNSCKFKEIDKWIEASKKKF
jgi:N-acetylglutamate synthase-like GNAT family acetyltransferase